MRKIARAELEVLVELAVDHEHAFDAELAEAFGERLRLYRVRLRRIEHDDRTRFRLRGERVAEAERAHLLGQAEFMAVLHRAHGLGAADEERRGPRAVTG